MSIEFLKHVIEQYGYIALFIGTFLEGETILLLAGFAAHSPEFHLDLTWVIVAAFAGSLSGDQTAFFVGRYWGKKLMARSEKWRSRAERVHIMWTASRIWTTSIPRPVSRGGIASFEPGPGARA